ncbi:FAD-dependent oxidoreductase [Epibacterium sp. SM1979]|uniref:FAD-dependent oxidoreductase n=1 Tax=Tritonibacter litoralis TaxID=2662264 RepID=A0A843YJ27_9RHOB|nr:FAD-binding oxidoreductase [Tritonibacter litoralis]MQQ09159.1 FAD-dependent oxidoreductase [Tritonibacter litoralis]
MTAPLLHINSASNCPRQADTVVIGGGIIGVCTAYWLARAGQNVVLLEKGRIGAEQSSRNWGWCRQQNRDARELPLSRISLTLWEQMMQDCGADIGFRRCGLLYLSKNEAEIDGWANWGRFARGEGVDTRMLSAAAAAEHAAATGQSWKGGVWSPTDGIADPAAAAPAIARGIKKHGGIVLQGCAARGVELSAGAVSGVVTEKGLIKTTQVVLAGGVWAGSFLHQIGVFFPQSSVRSSILSVAPGAQGVPDAVHTKDVSITKRGDGGYTLAISGLAKVDPTPRMLRGAQHFLPMFLRRWRSLAPGGTQAWRAGFDGVQKWQMDQPTPMEHIRILDPRPDARTIAKTLARGRQLFPALNQVPIQASWAGYIDSTPDGVPVIDSDIGVPGLALAAGLSGHGFGIGPGVGHLMADMVLARAPITQMSQYKLSRFSGSQWGKVSDF